VALVLDRGAVRRPLGLPANGLHSRLKRVGWRSSGRLQRDDFVDLLPAREDQQRLTQAAAMASQGSCTQVWDDGEDVAYDRT